ncbi:MAG: hypothetical protein HY778_14470 [Betaproteobacteria bacterium]|nr:hypothetical protein [Betaproteobacteria bacterium]
MALALAMTLALSGGMAIHATWTAVRQAWLSSGLPIDGRGAAEAAKGLHGTILPPGRAGGAIVPPEVLTRSGGWPDQGRTAGEEGLVPNPDCLIRERGDAVRLRMAAARAGGQAPFSIRGGGPGSPGGGLRLVAAVLPKEGVPERDPPRVGRVPWDPEFTRAVPAALDMDGLAGWRVVPGVALHSEVAMPLSGTAGRFAAGVRG